MSSRRGERRGVNALNFHCMFRTVRCTSRAETSPLVLRAEAQAQGDRIAQHAVAQQIADAEALEAEAARAAEEAEAAAAAEDAIEEAGAESPRSPREGMPTGGAVRVVRELKKDPGADGSSS